MKERLNSNLSLCRKCSHYRRDSQWKYDERNSFASEVIIFCDLEKDNTLRHPEEAWSSSFPIPDNCIYYLEHLLATQ